MEEPEPSANRVEALAALAPPLRRELFRVLGDRWTSRDEAATALGLARSAAAFHLDKLAEAGVAEVMYARPAGRTGPGAGRPAKLYRLRVKEVSASIPDRHYDLAGALLARSVDAAVERDDRVYDLVRDVAHKEGKAVGERAAAAGKSKTTAARKQSVIDVLAARGYGPTTSRSTVSLGNCPFDRLADEHPVVVCLMNFHLIEGLLEGLEASDELTASFDVQHCDQCCVKIHTT